MRKLTLLQALPVAIFLILTPLMAMETVEMVQREKDDRHTVPLVSKNQQGADEAESKAPTDLFYQLRAILGPAEIKVRPRKISKQEYAHLVNHLARRHEYIAAYVAIYDSNTKNCIRNPDNSITMLDVENVVAHFYAYHPHKGATSFDIKITTSGNIVGRAFFMSKNQGEEGTDYTKIVSAIFFTHNPRTKETTLCSPPDYFLDFFILDDWVLTASRTGIMKRNEVQFCLWDSSTGTKRNEQKFEIIGFPTLRSHRSNSFTLRIADNKIIFCMMAAGLFSPHFYVWNIESNECRALSHKNVYACYQHKGRIFTVGLDGTICIWDMADGTLLATYHIQGCAKSFHGIYCIAGKKLVSKRMGNRYEIDIPLLANFDEMSEETRERILSYLEELKETESQEKNAFHWAKIAALAQGMVVNEKDRAPRNRCQIL